MCHLFFSTTRDLLSLQSRARNPWPSLQLLQVRRCRPSSRSPANLAVQAPWRPQLPAKLWWWSEVSCDWRCRAGLRVFSSAVAAAVAAAAEGSGARRPAPRTRWWPRHWCRGHSLQQMRLPPDQAHGPSLVPPPRPSLPRPCPPPPPPAGSRGIGAEFVRQFAAKGNRVIATARTPAQVGCTHASVLLGTAAAAAASSCRPA